MEEKLRGVSRLPRRQVNPKVRKLVIHKHTERTFTPSGSRSRLTCLPALEQVMFKNMTKPHQILRFKLHQKVYIAYSTQWIAAPKLAANRQKI